MVIPFTCGSRHSKTLEDTISQTLLPALLGRPLNNQERHLLALPTRFGGLGIPNPVEQSAKEYEASCKVTNPLTEAIIQRASSYSYDIMAAQISAKSEISSSRNAQYKRSAADLKTTLPPQLQRAMDLAAEKGASSWLTVLLIEEHGFSVPFSMRLHCGMVGHIQSYPPHVPVVQA